MFHTYYKKPNISELEFGFLLGDFDREDNVRGAYVPFPILSDRSMKSSLRRLMSRNDRKLTAELQLR